jgi:hypothetical protein
MRSAQRPIGSDRLAVAHSLRWIRARLNWGKIPIQKRLATWGVPGPPEHIRREYPGSFSWACEVACLDEDEIRRRGLDFAKGKHSWLPKCGGLARWREWRAHRPKPEARRGCTQDPADCAGPSWLVAPRVTPEPELPIGKGFQSWSTVNRTGV